jgi:hypothetical protein
VSHELRRQGRCTHPFENTPVIVIDWLGGQSSSAPQAFQSTDTPIWEGEIQFNFYNINSFLALSGKMGILKNNATK